MIWFDYIEYDILYEIIWYMLYDIWFMLWCDSNLAAVVVLRAPAGRKEAFTSARLLKIWKGTFQLFAILLEQDGHASCCWQRCRWLPLSMISAKSVLTAPIVTLACRVMTGLPKSALFEVLCHFPCLYRVWCAVLHWKRNFLECEVHLLSQIIF